MLFSRLFLTMVMSLVIGQAFAKQDDFELDKIVTMMKQYLGYDEDDRTDETGQTPEDEQADMQSHCATEMYVMAFTGDGKYAGSDDSPYLVIDLANGEHAVAQFPDNPGDDMTRNKGDFWRFNLRTDLHLEKSCITKADVSNVIIQNGGNDAWTIASITTILASHRVYTVVTADIWLNWSVDGNPDADRTSPNVRLTIADDPSP